jgi:hypothetical protein
LFIGVAFDTFLVRTILVPAFVSVFGMSSIAWWPGKMPPVILSDPIEEERALLAGYWVPPQSVDQPLGDDSDLKPRNATMKTNQQPQQALSITQHKDDPEDAMRSL